MSALNIDRSASSKVRDNTLALFVSDVHLSENLPHTTAAFLKFLREQALFCDQLYLLGDLFEYWAGDDDLNDPYNRMITLAIREVSDAGVKVFWMAGNRDFLVGENFARETGTTLLHDPTQIQIVDRNLIITHGDALCTDDTDYMVFRAMVRQANWQTAFLSKPLAERKALISQMRKASNSEQQHKSMEIMDVNQEAVNTLFLAYDKATLIHGHTHRTALHHGALGQRYVLPDWDCDHASQVRGGWLSLSREGQLKFIDVKILID